MDIPKYTPLCLSFILIAVLLVSGCGKIPTIPTVILPTNPPNPTVPSKTGTPATTAPSASATTTSNYPTTQVDIYTKSSPWPYQDPADIVMSPNVLGFAWNLDEDPNAVKWAHDHGAKFIAEVSLWNHDSWRTVDDLPAALKTAYNTGWDGQTLFSQDMVYLNTNDPAFQQWLADFIKGQLDLGADGLVFDETSGTAEAVYQGGALDAYSQEGFGEYLAEHYSAAELQSQNVGNTAGFSYRQYIIDNGLTDKYKQGKIWEIAFGADYYTFLQQKTSDLIVKLAAEARAHAAAQGREILITANADPIYREPCRGYYNILDYYTFEHSFYSNSWREEPGYQDFPYGVPSTPKIKYTIGQGQKAVVLPGIYDYGKFQNKGLGAGTTLVLHAFAEVYANLGFFCYFDLEWPFLGMQFTADHARLRPYYAFLREHPEAFNGLSYKPETAVIVPPLVKSSDLGPVDAAQGTSFVLSQSNIPYDVINIEHELDYQVVIAGGYAWSDAQLAKLLDYARAGGTVIAMDERFASRDENYQEVNRPELDALKTDGTHDLGKGKFIFFGNNVGWNYWAKLDTGAFTLIRDAVTPYIALNNAPEGIQLLPYTGDNKLAVHILNYSYEENDFTTQKDISISVIIPEGFSAEGKTLTLLSPDGNAGLTLEYTLEDGRLSFTVPELYIWSVAVLG